MKIAVDLRGLHSGKISGVENYILNILERVIQVDHDNNYLLVNNAWRQQDFGNLKFINSEIKQRHWPNKIFNFTTWFFKWPKFENYFGQFDCLFLPNANFFAISEKTKLIVTAHDLSPLKTPEFYDFRRRLWHKFVGIGKTLRRADHIVAVSEYTKADIIELFGISEKKISVVYPGIDTGIFHPDLAIPVLRDVRNRYGLPPEYVLFLNTVEPRKNLLSFIGAFEKLDNDIPLIIGGKAGWKYDPIFARIEKSPKKRLIRYLGYIPEPDKPYLIKMATLVGFPSFYEGFGFPALEAMAVGVPAIVSSVTSLPEAVDNSCIMVNPYNENELARAMMAILGDEQLRNTCIKKGLETVKKFRWERSAQQILDIFNSVKQ